MIDRLVFARLLVVVASAALLTACQSVSADHRSRAGFVPMERPEVPREPGEVAAEPPVYVLEAGDQIDVKFYFHPELNESVAIRPDGKIALQLAGEVVARGLTPAALKDELVNRYTAAGLRNLAIAVILRRAVGQRVFVGGEVNAPKLVRYEGRLTLTQALFEAGDVKATAERKSVLILRDAGDGTALYMTVSVTQDDLRAGGDVALQPNDVVLVPRSMIAKANEFVEQYLSKMVPTWLSGTASFAYVKGTVRPEDVR